MDQDVVGGVEERRFAFRVGGNTPRTVVGVARGADGSVIIEDTSTPARVGDFYRGVDNALEYFEVPIIAVLDADHFVIAGKTAPAAADTFFVMRYATQRVSDDGSPIVSVTAGDITYQRNGVSTEVSEDTATPANSRPLPTANFNIAGEKVDLALEATAQDQLAEQIAIQLNTADTANNTDSINTEVTAINTKTPALVTGRVPVDGSGVTQPVSAASLPLPTGAATEATLSTLNGKVTAVDTGNVTVASSALPTGAATAANQSTLNTRVGDVSESAPATDTASSGLNGRLQRIAQRLTSLISLLPSALGPQTPALSLSVTTAANRAGNIVNGTLSLTNPTANAAPANAVGFIVEAESTNADSIRWAVGSSASTTVGMLMEPGRDSGYVPIGGTCTVSVCATASTGTNQYSIQWVLTS